MFIQSMTQAAEKKNVNTPVSNQTYDLVQMLYHWAAGYSC